jgi:hypothetical protein
MEVQRVIIIRMHKYHITPHLKTTKVAAYPGKFSLKVGFYYPAKKKGLRKDLTTNTKV